jgi:hypothetical protein
LGLVLLTSGASAPRGVGLDVSHAVMFHCQYCNMTAENMHEFNNVDCDESGNGCKDCHVFNDCHNYEQSGKCDINHDRAARPLRGQWRPFARFWPKVISLAWAD